MKKNYRLGNLQLRIMKVLWKEGPVSVAIVQESLNESDPTEPLAYTTVATMLRKMEARDLVTHREDGRRYLYEARVPEEVVTRSMTGDLVDRLFEGSLAEAVSHLLDTREVSPQELDGIERMIQEHKQQRQS